ncbi:Mrp/NBP35 family ATP-binding protein [Roseibium sp. MMSF_3544]|uniref:Mrp/NBP35 family ATP-binding protein n=1 Tax=unclassified Roseibium TaxID=2629323 RepID=UPI00273E5C41|nr:Mrp/NBP35 family ATP-binding protein [Roseibium sp. MMSF_3544]
MAKSRGKQHVSLTRETVLNSLKTVKDPATGTDIVAAGMVRALQLGDGKVRFVMEIDPGRINEMEAVKAEAEQCLTALDGCENVQIILTAHSETASAPAKPSEPQPIKPRPAPPGTSGPQKVPGIDRIVAVASGKGGVGKSTVAANLACALAAEGRRVGLLDADVYGPSQPKMLGISGRPTSPDGQMILPLRNHGVTMISIGLMTSGDQAVVWRGPMLMGALQQMMSQVQWGALDVLLVDLPPGTGDVQMTLSQKFIVDGAIIVSTPQDVALLDARKGIDMFNQMQVPLIGMIENMSTHICSNCGHEEHVFGHGGVAAEAEKLGVPLLAEIPLHLNIRLAGDGGTPIAIKTPDAPEANVFSKLAKTLVAEGHA